MSSRRQGSDQIMLTVVFWFRVWGLGFLTGGINLQSVALLIDVVCLRMFNKNLFIVPFK